jgi:bifunctional non-homologous end joining protein LigD
LSAVTLEVAGRPVRLTSLDKPLWPGFTKAQLVDYYVGIAPLLLPHLAGRAVTLGRFPDGINAPGFAQTECRGRPEWIATRPVRLRSGALRNYCVIEEPAALAWAANLGTLELHPFLHSGDSARPDFVVFDLDPGPGTSLAECCRVALQLRGLLVEAGLTPVAKTSGGYGMHVYASLDGSSSYTETKGFARLLAARLACEQPGEVTDRSEKELREGRVLVDWAQNNATRSTVAPYSPRATDSPSVSTPLTWEEVEAADPGALRFTPQRVLERVRRMGDLFAAALNARARLRVP